MEKYPSRNISNMSTSDCAVKSIKEPGLMDDISYLHNTIADLEDAIIRLSTKLNPILRMSGPSFETDGIGDEILSEAEYSIKTACKKINDIRYAVDNVQMRASL